MTEYNNIANDYKISKLLPFRLYVEKYSYIETINSKVPSFKNKSVLDLACGEGFYTRQLCEMGAQNVVGVDLSSEMIKLAKESNTYQNAEYIVQNCMDLDVIGQFDLVSASYLLNYATTKDELRRFAFSIFKNLKPGCPFITINDNPFSTMFKSETPKSLSDIQSTSFFQKYWYYRETFLNDDKVIHYFNQKTISVVNYHISPKVIEQTFRDVGFSQFYWKKLELDPSVDKTYWEEFMKCDPFICIVAYK